ncbi:serine hydrolase FSH [Lipomyces arxii]|uniref:serine hydrolase FSH n=1 Tax=Lipomyces arxii TaxID=56418 RepID=UPI0034CE9080
MSGKILFLHGYTQSGPSFAKKSAGLRKALKKLGFTTYYPSAPVPLLVTPDMPAEEQERLRGLGYKDDDSYAWFVKDEKTGAYEGMEQSWAVLKDYIKAEGPFVGVVGFSQGAVVAAVLCGYISKLLDPSYAFKFAVLFSGFKSTLPEHEQYFPVKIPTLHVSGANDVIVPPARSQTLIDASVETGRKVYQHPGGHFVPSNREVVTVVNEWITEPLKEAEPEQDEATA